MKKPRLIRLRLLLGVAPGKSRRRGVAIITVLAIISLMTVLVISFFTMAQQQKVQATNTVEMQRVVTLKDTVFNIVMAQIREATTLSGGSTPTIWNSGPGWLQTFHGSNTDLNRLYKLYSSEEMMVNVKMGESDALLTKVQKDLSSQWDQSLDMWVDLNAPMRPASFGKDDSNAATIRSRLSYPIADPGRYNGQESAVQENTEGFSYGGSGTFSMTGVDPRQGKLAMPVRWIYMLEDGSFGVVGKDGKFTGIGNTPGKPTKENPIVSRLAWWTDDESCKINVNTASLPIPWDTPRTSSIEDVWYAQHQPVNGECQHYPSHPSQTDMTAVLFPGYRYTPDKDAMPVGLMSPLDPKYASLIWNIAPFITEKGGTYGGTKRVNLKNEKPVPLDESDHLFATFDELYFKAVKEDRNLNKARESVASMDSGSKMLSRLEGSQFFLTTRSNSPEMTIWSTPRLNMLPVNSATVGEVGKTGSSLPNSVGAFDVTMATNSTIAGKAYFFQRTDSNGSRHNNFFAENNGRNADLQAYLWNLTQSIPPGYPDLALPFGSFAGKYGSPNPSSEANAQTNKYFDSTDRSQIVLSMLDFIRSTNLTPGYLPNAYGSGNGQVSAICGCGVPKNNSDPQPYHTKALLYNSKLITPKGSGRTYGPAELILFAHTVGLKKGNTATYPGTIQLTPDAARKWGEAKTASMIQVGMLVNAFSTRQGWAPLFAKAGIKLSSVDPTSATDPTSAVAVQSPLIMSGNGVEYPVLTGNKPYGSNDASAVLPKNVIPWGGMAGGHLLASTKVATLDPIIYTGDGAGDTNIIPLQLKWAPGKPLRVFLYDDVSTEPYNITQAIDLDLGTGQVTMDVDYTGVDIDALMQASPDVFPPKKLAVYSFVLPHGDYRLTAIPLRVQRGMFVPHGTDQHSIVEPILASGRTPGYVLGRGGRLADDQLLADPKIKNMSPTLAPHLAPVKQNDLCNPNLGTNPVSSVMTTASSNPLRVKRYAHGRMDGGYAIAGGTANKIPNRGSSDPLETGDFDTGVGLCPDGAYTNQPDDGDARDNLYPYYQSLLDRSTANPASFSPNRLIRCAVDFGSLPSGLQCRVPWQTLRFRPDPGMYDSTNQITQPSSSPKVPQGQNHYFPFSNYCGIKDHMFLDMFWVPVVEPWSISEAFASKGQINLNQQIYPFTYIKRTTGLNAVLRSERMMAIPDSASLVYKDGNVLPDKAVYRHWINAKETLKQLVDFRWKGLDPEGNKMPFNSFRTASEVCELWLVPEKNGTGADEGGSEWDLRYTIRDFWNEHRLTGDNMRERPYANIYPRLTTRSNVYRVHMIAQTLQKSSTSEAESFSTEFKDGVDPDIVTATWRGSALIERVINQNDKALTTGSLDYALNFDPTKPNAVPKLDNFYNYRVTEVKQLTE